MKEQLTFSQEEVAVEGSTAIASRNTTVLKSRTWISENEARRNSKLQFRTVVELGVEGTSHSSLNPKLSTQGVAQKNKS